MCHATLPQEHRKLLPVLPAEGRCPVKGRAAGLFSRPACEALDRASQRRLSGARCSLIKSAFKVLRTQIAQRRVPAGSIVIAFDVSEGLGSRLLQVTERAVLDQFRFVARKQALGVRVVVGFIGASHALFKALSLE